MANPGWNRPQSVVGQIQVDETCEETEEVFGETLQLIAPELERRNERSVVVEVGDRKLGLGEVALSTGEVARTQERLREVKEGKVRHEASGGQVSTDHFFHGLGGNKCVRNRK